MTKLIGQSPQQVPTNADLGDMAYKDGENLQAGPLTITDGKVGLGTADPWDSLVVYGGGVQLGTAPNTNNSGRLSYNTSSGSMVVSAHSTGGNTNMNFVTANGGTLSTNMSITSAGEVQVTSGLLELDGNDIGGTQVTIADDAVASITPPRNGGFMFITLNGLDDYPQHTHSGFIYYDVGLSLLSLKQATTGVGTSLGTVNTDVTGTTGTDGVTTVAVQSGVIKIENRSGSSGTYQITFL
jgi:hypothetical protein